MDARALHLLHAFASPAFPVGGFAYSHGLEAAMVAGEVDGAEALQDWLDGVLRFGAGRSDAMLMAAAARAETPQALRDVADLAQALAPCAERLRETMDQGTAFAETAAALHATPGAPVPHPVAFGQAAAALGLPLREAVAMYLHGFTANLISAAVRFLPLGQTQGQRVLLALLPTLDAVTDAALAAPRDALGSAAFAADLAAIAHETLPTRVFRT